MYARDTERGWLLDCFHKLSYYGRLDLNSLCFNTQFTPSRYPVGRGNLRKIVRGSEESLLKLLLYFTKKKK